MAQKFVCYDCGHSWDGYQPVCPGCGSINTHASSMMIAFVPDDEPEDDDDPQPGDVSDVWTD